MSDLKNVNDDNFNEEVLNAEGKVLVDFAATWCGPCKRQHPILEQFALENQTTVKVVSVDTDDAPNVVSKLGIRSVPTILLFENGKQTAMKVGLTSLAELKSLVLSK